MERQDSKNIILSVLGVAILFIAVVGVSYAIYIFTSNGVEENRMSTGKILMKFIESDTNVISITNAYPISDEVGKNQNDYFDFSLSSEISGQSSIIYEIRAKKIDVTPLPSLQDSEVKIYLEKEEAGDYVDVMDPINFRVDTSTVIDNEDVDLNTMMLHRGSFVNSSSSTKRFEDKYRLRIWMNEDSTIDETKKSFKIKINVYATTE